MGNSKRKICPLCGKKLENQKGKRGYCSLICYEKSLKINGKKNFGDRKCHYCEKPFVAIRYNQKFCSHDCYLKWYRDREKPVIIRKNKQRKCPFCKKHFTIHTTRQRYCSKRCAEAHYSEKNKGKLTPKLRLRFAIFVRDNFTCRYCGRNVKDDGIKLEIDHVNPKSKGGVSNNGNLITTCKDCNLGKGDWLLDQITHNKGFVKGAILSSINQSGGLKSQRGKIGTTMRENTPQHAVVKPQGI